VTDGPFAEAKEVVGGYWMIQVKSKEEAIDWAKRCRASDNEVIEVRQVFEMSDFPPDVRKAADKFPEMQAQSGQRTDFGGRARRRYRSPRRPPATAAHELDTASGSLKIIASLARMVCATSERPTASSRTPPYPAPPGVQA
jgi:hypothetical protein